MLSPLLLDKRHVSLEVVVHVKLSALLVDHFKVLISMDAIIYWLVYRCFLPVVVADILAGFLVAELDVSQQMSRLPYGTHVQSYVVASNGNKDVELKRGMGK